MSEEATHGGGDWALGRSAWAPTHKRNQSATWPFWENLLHVRVGDLVLHLQLDKQKGFIGLSVAATDGFRTADRPPLAGEWGYDDAFYKVPLTDFSAFPVPLLLHDLFSENSEKLRKYYEANRMKPRDDRKNIFYVVQAGRLQCLNGAYFSEVDDELVHILFGILSVASGPVPETGGKLVTKVDTGSSQRILMARLGQAKFSEMVRENYQHRCCFPSCTVSDDMFLTASHISRWADSPQWRGEISNGLCLCLMHDEAFEMGLFSLDDQCRIILNTGMNRIKGNEWCEMQLLPYIGYSIRLGRIVPSRNALAAHRARVGL